MSSTFKIRILLFILTLGFAVTAISLHYTFNKDEMLEIDARTIEQNIQKKERFVFFYLKDKKNYEALKTIHNYPSKAKQIVDELSTKKGVLLFTYLNNKLLFWGDDKIAPRTDLGLREGFNRLKTRNGWYEAIKVSQGKFSAVCIIPIKSDFPYQNKFLKNAFAPDLIKDNNLEVASFGDQNIYNIRNIDGEYIIAVKLKPAVTNSFYSDLELWMTILTLLFATIFVDSWCVSLAKRKQVLLGSVVLLCFFAGLKALSAYFPVFTTYFNVNLFDTRHYSGSVFFRSIGDFLISAIMLCWFLFFVYSYRRRIDLSKYNMNRLLLILIFLGLGSIIYLSANKLSDVFFDLIIRSDTNFDLSNILYLDMFSWVSILLMFIGAFCLYLLLQIILHVAETLHMSHRLKYILFFSGMAVVIFAETLQGSFNIILLLFCMLIIVQWKSQHTSNATEKFIYHLSVLLLFSIITSIKLSSFQFVKEREQRKIIAYKLESADDPNAVLLLFSIEQDLKKDERVINCFKEPANVNTELINSSLRKQFFDGYLSRYDLAAYLYKPGREPLYKDQPRFDAFRNLVLAGSIKVSENFYSINNTFGYQNYFGIVPITQNGVNYGTLVVTLKSKTFKDAGTVPEILVDNKMDTDKSLKNYSFAFYLNGKLLNQNGKFTYTLVNTTFPEHPANFTFKDEEGYNHLIYQPNDKKVIIVSTPVTTWMTKLGSVSFLFLAMGTLSALLMLFYKIWNVLVEDNFTFRPDNWVHILPAKQFLYSTRIQATLIGAIGFTLLTVGVITYVSISQQFKQQLQNELIEKLNKISIGLERDNLFNSSYSTERDKALQSFASVNATDISLYNAEGKLTFTTQNKIYDSGLLDYSMNPLAYIRLSKYQQSELLNAEQIGSMRFITAYKPLRNNRNVTIAYLALPYYAYESDYDALIGDYLNTLINVYALVLVTIAFFTLFLANRITYPLTLVSNSLGGIKIDGKNELIKWKSNDEIGRLIKEYNAMILALENSAQKLARSERESAWREMAKQVAHEIKNPLTPLKLGVQLLEKSWKGQDPNFDQKFARFSKSFIEQIESLANIASEFSNFAKVPDAPMAEIDLIEPVKKSIEAMNLAGKTVEFTEPDIPMIVRGNRDHLIKIFGNLLKNAFEAVPEGREAQVSVKIVSTPGTVEITVKDNGEGVNAELRDKIFNPNFTTKTSGTGLGLSFAKQGVENMLGKITFITSETEGTEFRISLPHPNFYL